MSDSEGLHLEWKSEWNDKCLQSLCAFANTDGGKLIIGKNDCGQPVAVSDVELMLEKLPHTISSHLAITPRVKKYIENNTALLCIEVQACSQPISYKGRYYVRSGSVTQDLHGNALNEFLYKKMSPLSWDSRCIEGVSVGDLDSKR